MSASSADEPRFPLVAVVAPAERAEEISGLLFELGCAGVELRDEATAPRGPGGGLVLVRASFQQRSQAEAAVAEVRAALPAVACELGEIVGDAWRDAHKRYFRPFSLTESIVVAPPWADDYRPPAGAQVLWMDPGRAFGTGLHATTRLCAAALARHRGDFAGARLLDVGTGSGILALTALLLGAAHSVAVDSDPDVLAVARDNAARNGLSPRIAIDGTAAGEVAGAFATVVANIRSDALIELQPALCARVARGGLLLLGGILAAERDEIASAFSATGLALLDIDEDGQGPDAWVALAFRR